MSDQSDTRIWRLYRNGELTEQTHVLGPHWADGEQKTGYDGDVDAWSDANKAMRPGCTQLMLKGHKLTVLHRAADEAAISRAIKSIFDKLGKEQVND